MSLGGVISMLLVLKQDVPRVVSPTLPRVITNLVLPGFAYSILIDAPHSSLNDWVAVGIAFIGLFGVDLPFSFLVARLLIAYAPTLCLLGV